MLDDMSMKCSALYPDEMLLTSGHIKMICPESFILCTQDVLGMCYHNLF